MKLRNLISTIDFMPESLQKPRGIGHLLAMISTADEKGSGSHGVLFRERSKIRQHYIEENILAGVIGLPSNLFWAGIPAALLIFDKSREPKGKDDIFFIDASNEFEKGTNQNRLRTEDIDKIVNTYHDKKLLRSIRTTQALMRSKKRI